MIDVASPRDAIDPEAMRGLNQPLSLLGHAVENPATGIHGDEELLFEIEAPPGSTADPEDWTVRVSGHCTFPRRGTARRHSPSSGRPGRFGDRCRTHTSNSSRMGPGATAQRRTDILHGYSREVLVTDRADHGGRFPTGS